MQIASSNLQCRQHREQRAGDDGDDADQSECANEALSIHWEEDGETMIVTEL